MKYCVKCGEQLEDDARFCSKCGAATGASVPPATHEAVFDEEDKSMLGLVAFILMVISCVVTGWTLIPLCWMVPMTVSYQRKRKRGEKPSMAFKVCTLLFVNLLAGILMIINDEVS